MQCNQVSFGMKMPTNNVLELASNMCIKKGHFESNIKAIDKMGVCKDIHERGPVGCAIAFDTVAEELNKQLPQLEPYVKKIQATIRKFNAKPDFLKSPWGKKGYAKGVSKIITDAEKKLGKELDVSTKDIEKALNSPSRLLNS